MKTRQRIIFALGVVYLLSIIVIGLKLQLSSNQSPQNSFNKQATCKAGPAVATKVSTSAEAVAEEEAERKFNIANLVTPVVAEFLQYVCPALFSQNSSPALD
ncbi:hypothetical protein [Pedobacter sp.]|uniref:hypothetical protein n=1 Tax=Pedobacter sp. TaxID=1411316 RepID=UPI003D7FF84D